MLRRYKSALPSRGFLRPRSISLAETENRAESDSLAESENFAVAIIAI